MTAVNSTGTGSQVNLAGFRQTSTIHRYTGTAPGTGTGPRAPGPGIDHKSTGYTVQD